MEDLSLHEIIDNLFLEGGSEYQTNNWELSTSQENFPNGQHQQQEEEEEELGNNSSYSFNIENYMAEEEEDDDEGLKLLNSMYPESILPSDPSIANIDPEVDYIKELKDEFSKNPEDLFNASNYNQKRISNEIEFDYKIENLPKRMRYPLDSSKLQTHKDFKKFNKIFKKNLNYFGGKIKFDNLILNIKDNDIKNSRIIDDDEEDKFKKPNSNTLEYLLESSEEYFDMATSSAYTASNVSAKAYERNSCYDLMSLGVLMEEYVDFLMESANK